MLYGKAAELVLYLLFKPDADVVKVYRLKNIFFCFKWGVKSDLFCIHHPSLPELTLYFTPYSEYERSKTCFPHKASQY